MIEKHAKDEKDDRTAIVYGFGPDCKKEQILSMIKEFRSKVKECEFIENDDRPMLGMIFDTKTNMIKACRKYHGSKKLEINKYNNKNMQNNKNDCVKRENNINSDINKMKDNNKMQINDKTSSNDQTNDKNKNKNKNDNKTNLIEENLNIKNKLNNEKFINLSFIHKSKLYIISSRESAKHARIIVRNLPFDSEQSEIESHFKKYGPVHSVQMVLGPDKDGKLKKKGCCFIQFFHPVDAARAIAASNMAAFYSRILAVDWAIPKDEYTKCNKNIKQKSNINSIESENLTEKSLDKGIKNSKDLKLNTSSTSDKTIEINGSFNKSPLNTSKTKNNNLDNINKNSNLNKSEIKVKNSLITKSKISKELKLNRSGTCDKTIEINGSNNNLSRNTYNQQYNNLDNINKNSKLNKSEIKNKKSLETKNKNSIDINGLNNFNELNNNKLKNKLYKNKENNITNIITDKEILSEKPLDKKIKNSKESKLNSNSTCDNLIGVNVSNNNKTNNSLNKSIVKTDEINKTIFLTGISIETNKNNLIKYFEKFGTVDQCELVYDKVLNVPKGSAFIRYRDCAAVKSVLDEYNSGGIQIDNKPLRVHKALSREQIKNPLSNLNSSNLNNYNINNINLNNKNFNNINNTLNDSNNKNKILDAVELRRRYKTANRLKKLSTSGAQVNDTRICVRNLPVHLDEKTIKTYIINNIKLDKKSIDKNLISKKISIKIKRDKFRKEARAQVSTQNLGDYPIKKVGKARRRSCGYGFINCGSPRIARAVLELMDHKAAKNITKNENDTKNIIAEYSIDKPKLVN